MIQIEKKKVSFTRNLFKIIVFFAKKMPYLNIKTFLLTYKNTSQKSICEEAKQLNAPCLSPKFETKKTAEHQPFLMLLKINIYFLQHR